MIPIEVPPEILDTAALEDALAGVAGALASLFKPAISAMARIGRWVYQEAFRGVIISIGDIRDLSINVASRFATVEQSASQLWAQVQGIAPTTVVNVTNSVVANLQPLYAAIDGSTHYTISIAEDLYNRSVAHADGVGQAVLNDARTLYNDSIHYSQGVFDTVSGEIGSVVDDFGQRVGTLEGVIPGLVSTAVGQAVRYTDAAIGAIEGEIVNLKPWVQAIAAATGAEVLAHAITTAESMFHDCCDFATGEVKPAWDKVKGLLGKLTSRGPLALVVMGVAAEVVVSWDRPTIVAMLKEAQANRPAGDVVQMREWARTS